VVCSALITVVCCGLLRYAVDYCGMLWIAVVCSALNTPLLTISGGMLGADYCGMLWIAVVCSALNTPLLTISGGMLSADYCGML